MNNIKKHIEQNSDLILATVRTGAALALSTIAITSIVKRRQTEAALGAASFVIRDLGGEPVQLIARKLIEYSGK